MPAVAASARALEGLGERDRQTAYAEVALQGRQGLGDREAVQEAVDRADAQRVAGGVDEEYQAVVPGAGGRVLRA